MSKTSTNNPAGRINDKGWVILFSVTAVALFALSGWAWWHFVRSNPERTFYAALENNFRTRGASRRVVQTAGAQKLEQNIQMNLTADHHAHALTKISQQGDVDATVRTETISTPAGEHVRYHEITTSEKTKSGQAADFASVLNIWGKSASQEGQATGELYGESILGIVPVGNLSFEDRRSIMDAIRKDNIYTFKDDEVVRSVENGRPVYKYAISVAPEQYVAMLKDFALAIGLTSLEDIDPSRYRDTEPLTFTIEIDVWSQNISNVEYSGGARTESFSSYGLTQQVPVPKESIPVEELQSKLQAIQAQ